MVTISRWWMVCAVCSAARLSTPAPPEPLPHLYASANQLPLMVQGLAFEASERHRALWFDPAILRSGRLLNNREIQKHL